jgi:hypothetical protein|tara:strand:+ start:224 stop:400 length:177 start_codon:yes stop_codon:yes gene_type:complete
MAAMSKRDWHQFARLANREGPRGWAGLAGLQKDGWRNAHEKGKKRAFGWLVLLRINLN